MKATFDLGPADRQSLKAKVADFERYAAVLDAHLSDRDHLRAIG